MACIRKTISGQVRKYRKARGLTQAALAEAARISEDTLWAIEREKSTASVETLGQLSRALNVGLHELVTPRKAATSEMDQELEELTAFLKVRKVVDVRLVSEIVQKVFGRLEGR